MHNFTSGDYLYLKTDKRQLSLKLDGKTPLDAVCDHIRELEYQIERMESQLKFIRVFATGGSVSHPDALKF